MSVNTSTPVTVNQPVVPPEQLKSGLLSSFRQKVSSILAPNATPRRNDERKEYSEVLRPTEVFSIPDIHGDLQALRLSLDSLGLTDARGNWIGGKRVVEFLGDYIDRGPESLKVLKYLLKLRQQAEKADGRVDFLLGNHEASLLGAIADLEGYRDIWLLRNGGDKLFEKVQAEYGLDPMNFEESWQKMRELFVEKGPYKEFMDSLQMMSQVDDVLYVHGGLQAEWADVFEKEGVDGVNARWQEAKSALMKGDSDAFYALNSRNGFLWTRFDEDLSYLDEASIARIASALKKRGINVVVVGHDPVITPHIHKGFEKHGIKLIGTDVKMSSGYRMFPGRGGLKIDRQGNIEAQTLKQVHQVHQEKKPSSRKAA